MLPFVFAVKRCRGQEHVCAKPVDLVAQMVRLTCRRDQVVLDPFMGSGSTALASLATGRRFIGIEIDPTYFRIAVRRIRHAAALFRCPRVCR
jgi:site-specific DNA-methyltransferase (adenine-specific)